MKRIINTSTQRTVWRGPAYVVDGIEITDVAAPMLLATEVVAERPEYDSTTERLAPLADGIENETEWHMGRFEVVALTEQEITDRRNAEADATDQTLDPATTKALLRATLPVDADDDTLATVPSLFPAWRPGVAYTAGDLLQHGNQTVRVVQGHTSQADWQPDALPALYSVLIPTPPGAAYPAWQPWNGDNATLYKIGDRVTHNGSSWESTLGNNSWEPGSGTGWVQFTP